MALSLLPVPASLVVLVDLMAHSVLSPLYLPVALEALLLHLVPSLLPAPAALFVQWLLAGLVGLLPLWLR